MDKDKEMLTLDKNVDIKIVNNRISVNKSTFVSILHCLEMQKFVHESPPPHFLFGENSSYEQIQNTYKEELDEYVRKVVCNYRVAI
jgi:hypothetical protein